MYFYANYKQHNLFLPGGDWNGIPETFYIIYHEDLLFSHE